jgi:hypothetical protein
MLEGNKPALPKWASTEIPTGLPEDLSRRATLCASRPAHRRHGDPEQVLHYVVPFELTQKRISRSGVADAPNVDEVGVLVRLREFVLHLKAKPYFGAASEGFRQADCHLWRDSSLAVQKVVKSLAFDTQAGRHFFYGQPQRLNALLANDSAWMWGILHKHFASLMVVHQVNVVHMTSLNTEDHAPIRPDCHAPEPF